ncbi:hypothetical protein [Peloplasma aerotolerans]|uniref:DUF3068 domain-containing protein n=1 Tax=Peloplasma aerotolerans TaxID=3044389 RepID=A0AAW6U4R8_9MOLU|nr:hypothetical protein [Mariniplasma sp. M4Ah]MDI6452961.1 hypothetical protein [Mariniplasma sp. M4Ah]
MFKWVIRFLYIMIISIATIYVYGSANYSRLEAYYADHMADSIDDTTTYLEGINTIMGLDYFSSNPIYQFKQDSGDYQFTLGIYAIGVTLENQLYDGLMVFVNNVRIVENNEVIEHPKLKIVVALDQSTYKSGDDRLNTATVLFDSEKVFPYSYVPAVFLLDADGYLQRQVENSEEIIQAHISQISIAYSNGTKNDTGALVYNDSLLFVSSMEPYGEAAFVKTTDLAIDTNEYRLSTQFEGSQPTDAELATFNLNTNRGNLGDYNNLIWRTMAIYILITGVITYFLFFHKGVRERKQAKRYLQKDGETRTVTAQPIFKDTEENEKDRK